MLRASLCNKDVPRVEIDQRASYRQILVMA